MIEGWVDAGAVADRCRQALDGWGLDAAERRGIERCGIHPDEAGGPAELEVRARHVVDIDRAIRELTRQPSLTPVWLRLPQDGLDGASPLEVMLAHASGLRSIRGMLLRECLESRFAA